MRAGGAAGLAMVLAPPDSACSTAVATHHGQGAIAVHPLRSRSAQIAHDAHSVVLTISSSDTRRGPRILARRDGLMFYAVLDHVDDPESFEVEEPSGLAGSGGSVCPDPLWAAREATWGRLAVALRICASLSRFCLICRAARR